MRKNKTRFFVFVFIMHMVGLAAFIIWQKMADPPPESPKLEIMPHNCLMMGGVVQFQLAIPPERAIEAAKALERAESAMQDFVDLVSSWNEQSESSRINAAAGQNPVEIDEQMMEVLLTARNVSELSDGAFDITVAAVSRLWHLSEDDPVIPDDDTLAEALELVDYRELTLDKEAQTAYLRQPGMRIDLGAIAKGAALDVAAQSLLDDGFANALIEAGGDLRALGDKGGQLWTVGIRDPRGERNKMLGALPLKNEGVATSGDYEKVVEIDGQRFHHLLDPRTGRPANKCVSVTVKAPTARAADALSTAFFVMGPEAGLALCEQLPRVEALFITPELKFVTSSGFPPEAIGK